MTSRAADSFEQAHCYAGSHAEGPPFERFAVLHSDGALRHAREVVESAPSCVAAA